MAVKARSFGDAKALKLKLTGEPDLDAERVRAVRRARADVWLGVDANQGFEPATLETIVPVLVECAVKLIEQPFARGREAQLDGFDAGIPVAADESVQDLAELQTHASRFDIVNIKLDKCGGLTEGLAMAAAARGLGLGVMVGNMLGSSLAMAPSWLLGQLCDIVDLDGPVALARDRTPSVSYRGGLVSYPDRGWGNPAAD
jgi:L-alanine-DL-glutamate epimerase-like enolase superfamily enzyme